MASDVSGSGPEQSGDGDGGAKRTDAASRLDRLETTSARALAILQEIATNQAGDREKLEAPRDQVTKPDDLEKILSRLEQLEGILREPKAEVPEDFRTVAGQLKEALRIHNADQERTRRAERRRWRWARWPASVVFVLMVASLSVFAQYEFDLLKKPDPTRGWKDKLWSDHRQEYHDCIRRMREQKRESIKCILTIGPS